MRRKPRPVFETGQEVVIKRLPDRYKRYHKQPERLLGARGQIYHVVQGDRYVVYLVKLANGERLDLSASYLRATDR